MTSPVKEKAKDKATDSTSLEVAGRAGLCVRGALHITIGLLALRIAFGDLAENADTQGAIRAVARQPMGRLLVALLALGFAGYAVWRMTEAFVDPEDKSGWKRVGYAGRGLLYAGFCVTAVRLVLAGSSEGGGGGDRTKTLTARALELPAGRFLVGAAALVLFAIAGWNAWRAISGSFSKELKQFEMSRQMSRLGLVAGTAGHAARAVAYALVGGFLVRAAIRHDPDKGVGLDAALKELAMTTGGPLLLAAVAIGLLLFGVFQLVLARYRRVLEPS